MSVPLSVPVPAAAIMPPTVPLLSPPPSLPVGLADDVRTARPWLRRSILLGGDFVALLTAVVVGLLLRSWFGGTFSPEQIIALWPLPWLVIALFFSFRLYADLPPAPAEELRRLCHAVTLSFIIFGSAIFVLRSGELYSRVALSIAWVLALVFVPIMRAVIRELCAKSHWWSTPAVIIGAGHTALILLQTLRGLPARGIRPVLVLDDDPAKQGANLDCLPICGPIDDFAPLVQQAGISLALVAMPGASQQRMFTLWHDHGPRFPHLIVIPALHGFASLWVEAKDLGGVLGLELNQSLLLPWPRVLKRTLDLVAVILGGLVILPLLLLIVVAVKCSSRGPLIYGQARLGRGAVPFTAWKFRTMRPDAAGLLAKVLAEDPALRDEWERDHKLRNDPRVTPIGWLLRKTSLDELPQLWNVLCGDMSLVGPRPITAAEIPRYGELWDLYTRVRPGITGLWQVSGRNRTTYEERVGLDAFYVHNWSPWLDAVILTRTVRTVLCLEGAY